MRLTTLRVSNTCPTCGRADLRRVRGCHRQLTVWVTHPAEVAFALAQLDQYGAPWALKRDALGLVAVFVPGTPDADLED